MRSISLSLSLFLLTIIPLCITVTPPSKPQGVSFPKEDGITVFTDQTYTEILEYHDTLFTLFYATWAGERGIPDYSKSVQAIQSEFPNVLFSKVEGDKNPEVRDYFHITGYPTYLLIHKEKTIGEIYPTISQDKLRKFIKEKMAPFGKEVTSIKQIEDAKAGNDVIIVYFGNEDKDISAITDSLLYSHSIPFLYCKINERLSDDVLAKYKVNVEKRTVKLFTKFDEKEHELVVKGELTKEHIDGMINMYSKPLVMKYDKDTYEYVFNEHHSALFFIQAKKDQFKSNDCTQIAKAFRGRFNVVLIDSVDTDFNKDFLKSNNITIAELPLIRYIDTVHTPMQYPIQGPYDNMDSIKKSIKDLLKNKEEAKAKAIPGNLGKVFVLEEKTFYKEVIDNDLDVFVKFYAPWCGHCKILAPVYEQLALKFADNPKIRIAEIDATVHEIKSIPISGFPTLILFPSGNKANFIQHNTDRSLENLELFLRTNAPHLKNK